MIEVSKNAQDRGAPLMHPDWLPQVISGETGRLMARLRELRLPASPASKSTEPTPQTALGEQLYDALARVKVLTSTVAMHLDRAWRFKLFRQLDALHDLAEWEPGDAPVQQSSFAAFLRTMIALQPKRRPGLGLSSSGNLIAAWTEGRDRLTLEFLPTGNVRWLLSYYDDEQVERAAGEAPVRRLTAVLAPYTPAHWFGDYAHQSSA
jgi:hypothetical protein